MSDSYSPRTLVEIPGVGVEALPDSMVAYIATLRARVKELEALQLQMQLEWSSPETHRIVVEALQEQNAKLRAALEAVAVDCRLRVVDGVVPISQGVWHQIEQALEGDGHE